MVKNILVVNNNKSNKEVSVVENESSVPHIPIPAEVNIFMYIFQDVFLSSYKCVYVFNKNV